jgi:glycogen synthase
LPAAGGGVVFADKVTTVSPTYAQEVYKPEFGFGMQVRPVVLLFVLL